MRRLNRFERRDFEVVRDQLRVRTQLDPELEESARAVVIAHGEGGCGLEGGRGDCVVEPPVVVICEQAALFGKMLRLVLFTWWSVREGNQTARDQVLEPPLVDRLWDRVLH